MNDSKQEAKKLHTKIAQLGLATIVRDQENKLHCIPGCEVEIIGVYTTGLKQSDLMDDISFSTEVKSMTDQQHFEGLDDEQAAQVAARMFSRAFDEMHRLGCPLNVCFAGILRAAITQTLRVADPKPLAKWMRDVANDLDAEAEAKKGKLQ